MKDKPTMKSLIPPRSHDFSASVDMVMWFLSFILLLWCNIYIFLFYWGIIALPYCVGFCHTSTWISHKFTYIPSLLSPAHLPPHPAPLACHRALAELPVSHSKFALAIYFTSDNDMFLCYSLNSSHPLFVLLCPQICPCLCSIAAPQIGSSMPSF